MPPNQETASCRLIIAAISRTNGQRERPIHKELALEQTDSDTYQVVRPAALADALKQSAKQFISDIQGDYHIHVYVEAADSKQKIFKGTIRSGNV